MNQQAQRPDQARDYYLQRAEMLGALKHELGAWARTRMLIVAVIVLAAAFLGGRLVVREMVARELQQADADPTTEPEIVELEARIRSLEQRLTRAPADVAATPAPANDAYPVYLLITPATQDLAAAIGPAIAQAGFDLQPYAGSLEEFESLVAIPDGSFINATSSFIVHSAGHREQAVAVAAIIETNPAVGPLALVQDRQATPSPGVVVFLHSE